MAWLVGARGERERNVVVFQTDNPREGWEEGTPPPRSLSKRDSRLKFFFELAFDVNKTSEGTHT